MKLDQIISTIQSNIARRGAELADLESLYSLRKALAYTKLHYKIVRAVRAEIKPLANAQKFDRMVLRELTDKRTAVVSRVREVMTAPLFRAGVLHADADYARAALRLIDWNEYTH